MCVKQFELDEFTVPKSKVVHEGVWHAVSTGISQLSKCETPKRHGETPLRTTLSISGRNRNAVFLYSQTWWISLIFESLQVWDKRAWVPLLIGDGDKHPLRSIKASAPGAENSDPQEQRSFYIISSKMDLLRSTWLQMWEYWIHISMDFTNAGSWN